VYAGGDFRSIGGRSRDRIAALDATTGRVRSWNPGANGTVQTIAVTGSTVYAGGGFTAIAGRSRRYVAALSARTGQTTAWNPGVAGVPREGSGVLTLAVAGSKVYLGGDFTAVGGRTRDRIAAVRAGTGSGDCWYRKRPLGILSG
jgi:trimeric autotransporter adhesin